MPQPKAPHAASFPPGNHILKSLTRDEYERLRPELRHVRLSPGQVLWEAGDHVRHAYFPTGGMVSLLSVTGEGSTVEVGIVGGEGLAGVSPVLCCETIPYRVVVQLPGTALRLGVSPLRREFARGGRLQELLLGYTHSLLAQVSQSASCHRFHASERRLSRWLLVTRDRSESDTLPLTQVFLAQMIGVPRTSVTAVALRLQGRGLIRYSRGRITVLDRPGLEARSCECYRVISESVRRYLAA